jgi:hypothetical protein
MNTAVAIVLCAGVLGPLLLAVRAVVMAAYPARFDVAPEEIPAIAGKRESARCTLAPHSMQPTTKLRETPDA